MTRAQLLETMDSDEYCLWEAEFLRSPWDERRADLRAGVVAAAVANYAGRQRKKPDAAPLEFMPYAQPDQEVVEPDFDYLQGYLDGR